MESVTYTKFLTLPSCGLRVGNVSTGGIEALLRRSVERLDELAGSDEESLLVLSLAV